ncbi:MAG: transposase [Bryobacterales bacterium]|nr:transposase [Bryobacterales bacterium]
MTTPPTNVVAGIDVGKSKLDAHLLDAKRDRQFNNDKAVFEPTGRYHRKLHQCLFDSGMETVLVNPLRSRRFAEAIGRLAKTDRVDAAMPSRFGTRNNPGRSKTYRCKVCGLVEDRNVNAAINILAAGVLVAGASTWAGRSCVAPEPYRGVNPSV